MIFNFNELGTNAVIFNDDCLNVLKTFDDESIDLCITDCPYKIVSGGCTNGAYGNCGGILKKDIQKNSDENIEYTRQGKLFKHNDIKFSEWLPELFRVMKNNSHIYIMINARNLCELQTEAEKAGFKFQNILIWDKGNSTPNRYYLNSYEMILMLRKGNAKNINNMGTKNLISVKNIIGNKKHPTEKPVELLKILIENSSNENDTVLDLFMGSGSTGQACKETNRNFIGIEIDEKYFETAKERIVEY